MRSDLLLLEERTGCSPTHRMEHGQVLWYILWLLLPALTVWMLRTIFSGCWLPMCLLCLGMANMNKIPSADRFRRRAGFLWSGEGLTGTKYIRREHTPLEKSFKPIGYKSDKLVDISICSYDIDVNNIWLQAFYSFWIGRFFVVGSESGQGTPTQRPPKTKSREWDIFTWFTNNYNTLLSLLRRYLFSSWGNLFFWAAVYLHV